MTLAHNRLIRQQRSGESPLNAYGRLATPSETISCGDWSLTGYLRPINQRGPAEESRRIRTHHAAAKRTDVVSPLRKALKDKSKKYGLLDALFIVAVNASDMFYNGNENDLEIFFGDEQIVYFEKDSEWFSQITRKQNGLWSDECQRIDAVVMFQKVDVLNLAYASACLYLNPWKNDTALPEVLLRLPHAKVNDGKMKWLEGENIARILGNGQ